MYGAVFGDIIGSTYELHNVKTVDFPPFPAGSTFTDDTVMTIAVAEKLLTQSQSKHFLLPLQITSAKS
jgi:ADP-ribosylglycohydrolase